MKKGLILIAIIGVILLAGMKQLEKPGLTEEQIAAIQEAVIKKHSEIVKYAENLEVDKFYESIIDSGKGTIIQDGRILSREESLDMTKKGFEGIEKLKYEFGQKSVKVLSSEIAIFTGQGETIVTIDTGETFDTDFAVTSVFVLKDGEWKIVHGHHSTAKAN